MSACRPIALVFAATLAVVGHATAQEKAIVVASTTSIYESGLFGHLLPIFTQTTGIAVNVMAVGTGQAMEAARQGKADVVFVHARIAELQFVAEGHGVKRFPVMSNDFVLVGPKSDPAGIKDMKDVAQAPRTIRDKQATFISRGDSSGTHLAELALWYRDAGIYIENDRGRWHRSIGQGMTAALIVARASDGYTLSDRGTWNSFKNKGDLQILLEGDKRLFNEYSVILVNPDRHPQVKKEFGQTFVDWLVSQPGQTAIADYKINGKNPFSPHTRFWLYPR